MAKNRIINEESRERSHIKILENLMKLHMITFILLIIGGINWLLFAIFGAELGHWVLGGMDGMVARIVYILVGLSAIYELASHKKCCTMCKGKGGM